jgi:hypothetical protein
VHVEYLEMHDQGETWAEVTEGNPWPIGFVWERLRYDWSKPGSVKGTVIARTSSSLEARVNFARRPQTAAAAGSR